MLNWTFNAADYDPTKPRGYELIDAGDHRCRIEIAEEGTSKSSGKQMIVLTLSIAGYKSTLKSYTVLDPDNTERTNQNLGYIYECFGLAMGNLDIESWVGSMGGVCVKHEEYIRKDGNKGVRAVVGYFLAPEVTGTLPVWPDSKVSTATHLKAEKAAPSTHPYDDTGLPFTDDEASVIDKLPF